MLLGSAAVSLKPYAGAVIMKFNDGRGHRIQMDDGQELDCSSSRNVGHVPLQLAPKDLLIRDICV